MFLRESEPMLASFVVRLDTATYERRLRQTPNAFEDLDQVARLEEPPGTRATPPYGANRIPGGV